ncbi:MAG: hypothetical protein EXR62_17470 [Chloroflexi bacterium]|nr:hypothetical protein [Chloroflexota bacterium]
MRPINFLKRVLRLLIITGSFGGFLGGWAFLARTEQPAGTQPAQPASIYVTPTPLPPLNLPALPSLDAQPLTVEPLPTVRPLPTAPPPTVRQPRLRTRGS